MRVIFTIVYSNDINIKNLYNSIDCDIDILVILTKVSLNLSGNKFVKNIIYKDYNYKFQSVSQIWNHFIESADLPNYIIINDDVVFGPGFLQSFINSTDSNPNKLQITKNLPFACFSITPYIIEKYGLFDENYKQAYWEDQDYITNILRDRVTQITPQLIDFNAEDSEDILLFNKNGEYEIHHVHCGTYTQSSEEHRKHIDDYINRNALYYSLKWKNKNKPFDIYK